MNNIPTSAFVAIIGLGYVGLPLAVEFGKKRNVVGFDTNPERINELKVGIDKTKEIEANEISSACKLEFTSNSEDLKKCSVFIITVPTPIDNANRPDLSLVIRASEMVGSTMSQGAIVVLESTVYPGVTEDICAPILEKVSGKKYNIDFFCGYSPERINPGDKTRRLTDIKKITSGSTLEASEVIDKLYKEIIRAGTYKASSIKVAEAAKVIENTQRDVNIALMNELSLIFKKMEIDTLEVLEAAGTKWNFLPFRPGLVGGHCIGVDPYYLTHKAQELGYHSEVILAGRRINDNMADHIADDVVKLMLKKKLPVLNSSVLILGLTFKENCPDFRNSKVFDLMNSLKTYGLSVDVYDPCVDVAAVQKEFKTNCLVKLVPKKEYSAVIIAVAHDEFRQINIEDLRNYGKENAVIFDVKGIFPKEEADGRL